MGLRLFKGLCLFFLQNVPGAMFIQGGTFIPDSRVTCKNPVWNGQKFKPKNQVCKLERSADQQG